MPPVQGLRFTARGVGGAAANDALVEYLSSANLKVVELEESDNLQVHMTRFPELTFAHVDLPRSRVEWPRDELSLTRAAIVLCVRGRVTVTSGSTVLQRGPGLFLIPPGTAPVVFETRDALNEILYISAPASLVHELDVRGRSSGARPEVPANVLAPLLAFTTSLSSGTVGNSIVIGPLRSVALEIARALARLIAEGDPSELTLFSRTIRLIVDNRADAGLTVPKLATLAGVSPRSLQAAFAAEGTTVARELRATRVRAAQDLRERHPGMPATEIARAVGFGSVATLYRALRTP
ncbi:helix-turn-helix domain-containing protein [Leifsonia sp. NPDC058194]|uniref:helix-turn-helix domain-containing protein n=1 Tax=Leifsonia sp. NPDC058194 TaxID=3346374 RepID=UPI0036D9F734